MGRRLWWGAVVLAVVVVVGCGGATSEKQQGAEEAAVTIIGKDNVFEPATVEIKASREYEFVLKNQGTAVHNLVVQTKDAVGQDFASDAAVDAGQDSEFKVKINREGTYVMQCTYHPEMKGELKVVR